MYSCNITGRSRTFSNESASAWLSTVKPFTPWRRANSADDNGFRKAPRNAVSGNRCIASALSISCVLGCGTCDRSRRRENRHLSTIVSTSSTDGLLEKNLLFSAEGRDATARAQSSEHGTNTARCKPQFFKNVAKLAGVTREVSPHGGGSYQRERVAMSARSQTAYTRTPAWPRVRSTPVSVTPTPNTSAGIE